MRVESAGSDVDQHGGPQLSVSLRISRPRPLLEDNTLPPTCLACNKRTNEDSKEAAQAQSASPFSFLCSLSRQIVDFAAPRSFARARARVYATVC